jgi:hypothetical protein
MKRKGLNLWQKIYLNLLWLVAPWTAIRKAEKIVFTEAESDYLHEAHQGNNPSLIFDFRDAFNKPEDWWFKEGEIRKGFDKDGKRIVKENK